SGSLFGIIAAQSRHPASWIRRDAVWKQFQRYPYRDGFRAGWSSLRLPAKRAASRDKKRRAPGDALCLVVGGLIRRTRITRRYLRSEFQLEPICLRLLHNQRLADSQPD